MTIQYWGQGSAGLLGSFQVVGAQPVPVAGTYVIINDHLYKVQSVQFVYNSTEVFSIDAYVVDGAE